MNPPQHRIFMSHSHLDNDFGTKLAQDLCRVLKDESAVWYDVLGLHGGEEWWEKIVEELTARDVFLLVLSPDAMGSKWVRREINMAFNEGRYIIPLHHRLCDVRADLKTLQIISFLPPKPYEMAFGEVLRALGLPANSPVESMKQVSSPSDQTAELLLQLQGRLAAQDWPDVIRKADYLIAHMPASTSSPVYRMKGLALLEEGEEQQAQEALETALALVSDHKLRLTLLSDYTALLARQGKWTKLLQQVKEALRLVPNDPAWLATQQQAQSELTKSVPLAASLEQIDNKSSSSAQPPQKTKDQWLDDGNALKKLKRYEEAIAAYDQAIELDPHFALAYKNKGNVLNELKRYEEAIAAFDQAIQLDPNFANAYIDKGLALNGLKRYEEALYILDQAIRLAPNFANAYINKGNALNGLKRYYEAIVAYDDAIELAPNFALAYNNKGNPLLELKRYEEAIDAYDQAIRLAPQFALAYKNKGNALFELKRYEEALHILDQVIRLEPNSALAYKNKGNALFELKRYKEAITAYDQAIRLDPHFALAYKNKGKALDALNRYEEAIAAYDQAIQLDPNLAIDNNKSNTLERLGNKKEAQQAHARAGELG